MIRSLLTLTATLLLGATIDGAPDASAEPFATRRVVSPSGRYYALLQARNGTWPGPFQIVRRREGAEPLQGTVGNWLLDQLDGLVDGLEAYHEPVRRDPEDPLVTFGTLPQLPADAAVTEAPLGLVLFDQYRNPGVGRTLCFLDAEGRLAWDATLADLFGGAPEGAVATPAGLAWSAAWGVDHERRSAWVLTQGHQFRELLLRDGAISTPGPVTVARWCRNGPDDRRRRALNAVLRAADRPHADYAALLGPLADDPLQPLDLRLHAAAICTLAGDPTDRLDLFDTALEAPRTDPSTALFAACHRPELPIELLCDALLGYDRPLDPRPGMWVFAHDPDALADLRDAFGRFGAAALPRLAECCADTQASPIARTNAAVLRWSLGGIGLPTGLRALIVGGAKPDADRALNALIRSAPADLPALLTDLLRDGTHSDIRLGDWFAEHPDPGVAPLLRRRLAAHPADSSAAIALRAALEACRAR